MRLEPDKKLHSRAHVLADDLSRALGEPKRFAAYLGIAELYYESDLRALMRRVLEKSDLPSEARGKYFFAALRGLFKKPRKQRPKRSRRRKKRARPTKTHAKNTPHRQGAPSRAPKKSSADSA